MQDAPITDISPEDAERGDDIEANSRWHGRYVSKESWLGYWEKEDPSSDELVTGYPAAAIAIP